MRKRIFTRNFIEIQTVNFHAALGRNPMWITALWYYLGIRETVTVLTQLIKSVLMNKSSLANLLWTIAINLALILTYFLIVEMLA